MKSLGSAVAASTEASRASGHHIPRLLLPEAGGFALTDLVAPVLLGMESFEGVLCYRLTGDHPRSGVRYELWIGKDDFLIRRILTTAGSTGQPTEEIRRNVRINLSMPKESFDSKPTAPAK